MSDLSWVAVATLSDIPLRGARRVKTPMGIIGLFKTAENLVFAIADQCPHKQGPLSQGIVHNGCVTCPLHNWVIDLASGEAQGADKGSVQTFPVEVRDDGEVYLGLRADAHV